MFKTRQVLPFNAHQFFRCVQRVNEYPEFIPNMPVCQQNEATRSEVDGKYGKNIRGYFEADTQIGFRAVNFNYVSYVNYSHPKVPINFYPSAQNNYTKGLSWVVKAEAQGSRIFDKMNSKWQIRPDPASPFTSCIVDYKIEIAFASPLYSAITSQFFDFLVKTTTNSFEERCTTITNERRYADEILFDPVRGEHTPLKQSETQIDLSYRDRIDEESVWQFISSDI